MNDRAKFYRRMHDIPESWGTAVNVQSMVFGNMGETRATGVAFTRNPSTGENRALRRVPDQRPGRGRGRRHPHAAGADPGRPRGDGREGALDGGGAAGGVRRVARRRRASSRRHYRDMQDIEFTVERGRLYMLQTRNGKRTAKAALKIAVDMADEGLITQRGGGDARRAGLARPAAAPDHRPGRRARRDRHRACRPRPARRPARSCSPPSEAERLGRRARR